MVDETYNNNDYDPDSPPERPPFDFYGRLTNSVRVNNIEEATAAGVGENYKRYCDASERNSDDFTCWFLTAEAVDATREDGTAFEQSDIVALKSKKGNWLTDGMPPDIIAQQYRSVTDQKYTASYRAAGAATSAVGKVFHFKETSIKIGKSGDFSKNVSLWPVEFIEDETTVPMREQPYANRKTDAEGSEANPQAPADAAPEEVQKVAKAIAGGSRDDAFKKLMSDASVKGIARVLGHDLIAAATDGKLPDLLIEAGYLSEVDGKLTLAAA